MLHHRLLPLLIVGAACMPLVACGGDDAEPTGSATPPGSPAGTPPTVPGDAPQPDGTPTASDDGAGSKDATKRPTNKPGTDEPKPADDASDSAATPNGGEDPQAAPEKSPAPSASSGRSSKDSDPSGSSSRGANGKQPNAPATPKALEEYAKGGAPATADQAASVRKSMLEFQGALAAQDAGKACSYTIGLPAKSDPGSATPSCESLIVGSKTAPPTARDREMIQTAKITVDGDRASIEMAGAGVPMPFRNVDGRWRIDYGTLLGIGKAAG